MKRGEGDRFTPSGIDCYFVTIMTDNQFKQQTLGRFCSFRREDDLLFTPKRSDLVLLLFSFLSHFLLSRLFFL